MLEISFFKIAIKITFSTRSSNDVLIFLRAKEIAKFNESDDWIISMLGLVDAEILDIQSSWDGGMTKKKSKIFDDDQDAEV